MLKSELYGVTQNLVQENNNDKCVGSNKKEEDKCDQQLKLLKYEYSVVHKPRM
jgi:hypothetical protein